MSDIHAADAPENEPVTVEPEDEAVDIEDLMGEPLPDEDAKTDALLKGTLDLAAALTEEGR